MPKAKSGRPTVVTLKDLVRDPRLQVRESGLNSEQVEDIAAYAKRAKGPLPNQRLVIYKTCLPEAINVPPSLYLVGGFHRCEGYMQGGLLKVPAMVYEGTWADALKAAAKENAEHLGLHRTRADKRRAVELMLQADSKMSARDIALHIQVSHTFVSIVKRELAGVPEPVEVATLPDTEQVANGMMLEIPAKKQKEPEEAPKKPEQGGENEFRWGDAALMIGSLVKAIDKCANVYKRKKSLEHQGLLRLMSEVEKDFKKWSDWCAKEAKKEAKS